MQKWKRSIVVIVAFALSNIAFAQQQSKRSAADKGSDRPAVVTQPVTGTGTPGQITKWIGSNSTSAVEGDSTITEDKFGNIGVGTTNPTSRLNVVGTIELTAGGLKFPDGSSKLAPHFRNQSGRCWSSAAAYQRCGGPQVN